MAVKQRCQAAPIGRYHPLVPGWVSQYFLYHQGVHLDQAGLEQVPGKNGHLLGIGIIAADLPLFAVQDKVVGAVPVLDDM